VKTFAVLSCLCIFAFLLAIALNNIWLTGAIVFGVLTICIAADNRSA